MDKNYLINFRRLLILSALLPLIHGAVRPIFNIAHMVNSIKEIDVYLSRGANVIEADVSFSPNGTALHTFHGAPCDCARFCKEQEDIEKYLAYVREITKPENINYKEQLVLLFLDLKISSLPLSVKAIAGSDLAEKVISNLFEFGTTTSKIKLLLSIGHVSDYDFVLGFQRELASSRLQHLNAKIGWDTGLNDEVSDVISFWRQIQITNNIWLGDGISNCISPFYSLERLTEVLSRRDSKGRSDPIIDKVYHWTIDLRPNLRASLRFGVDGIITNHPERLYAILKEPGFSAKYRLATHDDDPWKRIQSYPHDKPPANANRIINKPTISRESVSDLITSFSKYLGGFVRRRLPVARN